MFENALRGLSRNAKAEAAQQASQEAATADYTKEFEALFADLLPELGEYRTDAAEDCARFVSFYENAGVDDAKAWLEGALMDANPKPRNLGDIEKIIQAGHVALGREAKDLNLGAARE